MKLTPKEETLIHALREIDRQNHAGGDQIKGGFYNGF